MYSGLYFCVEYLFPKYFNTLTLPEQGQQLPELIDAISDTKVLPKCTNRRPVEAM
jgi:hypothetical protein